MPVLKKRTKIVCTLGPASETVATLIKMIRAGMNVARLNFSHGNRTNHRRLASNVRVAAKRVGAPVGIIADLAGPKIRVGVLPNEGVKLTVGERVVFESGRETMRGANIPIPYVGLARDLKRGDRLLLDDGLLEAQVESIRGAQIRVRVLVGGLLMSHKGVNAPTATLRVPAVTERDWKDLCFALNLGVDFVALSFVRRAADVLPVRKYLKSRAEGRDVHLIAKIEKHEAVEHFEEILAVVDGVMIARGDLGIEMPAERVPVIQKEIIGQCLRAAKPVIVATQMLDSMIRNPRPTRAEVSDVANAVIDHADAVMLSGETAIGKHPVAAVTVMSQVIHETEGSRFDDLSQDEFRGHLASRGEAVGEVARLLADAPGVAGIAVTTLTGASAREVARFRPELPIIGCTSRDRVLRQLTLSWAVLPILIRRARTLPELARFSLREVIARKLFRRGKNILLVTGKPVGKSGTTNHLEIIKLRP